jgi:MFS transporter, ACS family, tartrate transporter
VMDRDVEISTMRRVSFRLLPFLFLLYIFCWLDRSNISIAALQMNSDLKFSSAAFGFGAGIFFLSYSLFEVPSNLLLARLGARRWLARIAITWGLLACSMMWVRTPQQFYAVRFLLGMAEAGFFPGIIYYLSLWFPATYRARAISGIIIGIPLSQVLGAPLGGALLGLTGMGHLAGWQWLFLVEGLPPVLLGFIALAYLTDRPEDARWLSKQQREWVIGRLEREQPGTVTEHISPLRALAQPVLWVLIFPYFALCTIAYGATFWTPLLVRDALGTSDAATSLIVGGTYLIAAIIYPLAGMLSDRIDDRCGLAALGLAVYCVGGIGVALLPHSMLRVGALVVLQAGNPIFMTSFWCVPSKFLKGSSAAAAIALVSSVGTSGGFFGPSIIGFLKQTTGSDTGAFLGLAGLALLGALVCIGLRQTAAFSPSQSAVSETPISQNA